MSAALEQSIRNEQYLREERDNLRARLAELEGGNALGRAALNRVTVERDEAKARLAELEAALVEANGKAEEENVGRITAQTRLVELEAENERLQLLLTEAERDRDACRRGAHKDVAYLERALERAERERNAARETTE